MGLKSDLAKVEQEFKEKGLEDVLNQGSRSGILLMRDERAQLVNEARKVIIPFLEAHPEVSSYVGGDESQSFEKRLEAAWEPFMQVIKDCAFSDKERCEGVIDSRLVRWGDYFRNKYFPAVLGDVSALLDVDVNDLRSDHYTYPKPTTSYGKRINNFIKGLGLVGGTGPALWAAYLCATTGQGFAITCATAGAGILFNVLGLASNKIFSDDIYMVSKNACEKAAKDADNFLKDKVKPYLRQESAYRGVISPVGRLRLNPANI